LRFGPLRTYIGSERLRDWATKSPVEARSAGFIPAIGGDGNLDKATVHGIGSENQW
jgi:hypothetical protein